MTVVSTTPFLELAPTAPLGAHHDGRGASFALFSSVAEAVQLCLFDDAGEEHRLSLQQGEGFAWQGYLPDARPGQRYRLERRGRQRRSDRLHRSPVQVARGTPRLPPPAVPPGIARHGTTSTGTGRTASG